MWRLCSFLGPCIHSSLEFNVLETFRLWKTSKEETRVVFHQVLQIVGPFLFQSWLFSLSLTLFFFSCHHLKHCLILELLLFSRTLGIFDGQINQLYIGNKKHWFVYTDNTFLLKMLRQEFFPSLWRREFTLGQFLLTSNFCSTVMLKTQPSKFRSLQSTHASLSSPYVGACSHIMLFRKPVF